MSLKIIRFKEMSKLAFSLYGSNKRKDSRKSQVKAKKMWGGIFRKNAGSWIGGLWQDLEPFHVSIKIS